jgi:hypothetical protein
MRYKSKQDVIDDIRTEHDTLCALLGEISVVQHQEQGVWGDGWTLCDLVAHLAEWQRMFLDWYSVGEKGRKPSMPVPGYKWNEISSLNRAIWEKHRSRDPEEIRADFDSGYLRILKLIGGLSPRCLLIPGYFQWTGKYPLTTYLVPNTASHYRFAIKVIRRWRKRSAK